jgi:hypothetical protein
MSNRIGTFQVTDDFDRIERARETLAFCEALVAVLTEDDSFAMAELLRVTRMRRTALAILHEHSAWTDWT